jgi:hypothetical protein
MSVFEFKVVRRRPVNLVDYEVRGWSSGWGPIFRDGSSSAGFG